MALIDKLTAIANAIRSKTGKSATLTLDEMPTEIASIETGSGGGTEDLNDVLSEQETLIAELKSTLRGKAIGGDSGTENNKYKCALEYLESTGTQWIDTGYAFEDDFSWEIDFDGIASNKTVFGGRTSSTRTALLYQLPESVGGVTACPISTFNGQTTPFKLADLSTGRHCVRMSVNSNKASVWVDGVKKFDRYSFNGSYISGTTQVIFADNFGGGNIQEHTSSKVYGLKMWQSVDLVRDFIPVLDLNNIPCMYDKVSGELFYNQGTGEFLYEEKATEIDYQNALRELGVEV